MRLVVLCGGQQSRWGNYLDVPKYMAPVLGEPVAVRTFRLFKEHCPDIERFWVLPPGAEEFWPFDVQKFWISTKKTHESYKLTSSSKLWKGDTVIVVFGDVFFTEAAVKRIAEMPVTDIEWFGRRGGNKFNGNNGGEIFGLKFPVSEGNQIIRAANKVRAAWQRGETFRTKAWEIYRTLNGLPLMTHSGTVKGRPAIKAQPTWAVGEHFNEIDDLTDDFDLPRDYDGWKAAVEQNALLAVG